MELSFSVPKYNKYIGLQEICEQAKNTSAQIGGANFYYCEMTQGDNLDVYLGVRLNKLRISDLYKNDLTIKKPAILFTWHKAIDRNDSLRVFIRGKKFTNQVETIT